MAFPLLPSMQDETKVAFTDPGKWISSGQNTLKGLVDSLKVNANNQSTISSIPDVWASVEPLSYIHHLTFSGIIGI